ncbi:hypothetical protein ALT1000_50019 [Alteromonas macleodii]
MKFKHSIICVGQYLFMASDNNNTKSNSLSLAESVGSNAGSDKPRFGITL